MKKAPSASKMPKGFKSHRGRCSFDAPQKVWGMKDFDELELYRRDGEVKIIQVCSINWTSSFLPEDIIGWRILDGED
jgi:hypothetical protein|tara:strand:- start:371 stop:601 length:231 start_codon:yes stop_codon:yes gene_type:complete